MRLLKVGLSLAILALASGLAFGQTAPQPSTPDESGATSAARSSGSGLDWLSPAPLAWRLPETFSWAESPIKLNIHERTGYNDNILNVYSGAILPPGTRPGDFFLNNTVALSTKFDLGQQQFFADAQLSSYEYGHDTHYDSTYYLFDIGTYFAIGSTCKGKLYGSLYTQQTPRDELAGPGIDTQQALTATETASCNIYRGYNLLFNSGFISQTHSLAQAQALDNSSIYAQGGLQYALGNLDSLKLMVKYTERRFTNSVALAAVAPGAPLGSANSTNQLDYQVFYDRTISEKLDLQAMVGIVQNSSLSLSGSASAAPAPEGIYTISADWRPSAKWELIASSSRTVGQPISIIAAAQASDVQSIRINYAWTPKLTFTTSVNRTTLEGHNVAALVGGASTLVYYGPGTLLSETLKATYQITPFISGWSSFVNSNRESNGLHVQSSLVSIGVDYQPY